MARKMATESIYPPAVSEYDRPEPDEVSDVSPAVGPGPKVDIRDTPRGRLAIEQEDSRGPFDVRAAKNPIPKSMPVDLAILAWCVARCINVIVLLWDWYNAARSFVGAYRRGRVGFETYYQRRRICGDCSHKYTDPETGRSFCAYRGGCGCGNARKVAALESKLTLSAWSCPAGKFGTGDSADYRKERGNGNGK